MKDYEFNDNHDNYDPTDSENQKNAETGVIGFILGRETEPTLGSTPELQRINRKKFRDTMNLLQPEYFTGFRQPIFKFIKDYYYEFNGYLPSLTEIVDKLKDHPALTGINLYRELRVMMDKEKALLIVINFERNAEILQNNYRKRELRNAANLLSCRIDETTTDDEEAKALSDFDRRRQEIEDKKSDGVKTLYDIHIEHLIDIKSGNIVDPIPTGFKELDAKLNGGLAPATLTVIGARPAVGKSAIMTQIAYQMAREKKPVLIFTMEMPSQQVETRIANQQIDPDNLPEGVTMEMVKNPTNEAISFLNNVMSVPIYISEEQQTLDQIEQITAKYRRTKGIRAVFIDYAGLIRLTSDDLKLAQCERLDDWGGRLKDLAKRYEIPVIILSQLNREAADGRRPSLVNLRGSDGIGNASDVIIFLHRPENGDKRNIEIILDKNRDGETGIFNAEFTPDRVRFDNLTPKEWKEKKDKIRQNANNIWKSTPLAKKTKQKNCDLEMKEFVEREL